MENKELLEKIYQLHLEQLEKIGSINTTLVEHKAILDHQQKLLDEHISRTEASEARLEVIEKQVLFVNNIIKFVTGIGALILACLEGLPALAKLLSFFRRFF